MSKFSKSFRKTVKRDVVSRLQAALGDLEQSLGKKKFRQKIKKAGKILTADLKKTKLSANKTLTLPAPSPDPVHVPPPGHA